MGSDQGRNGYLLFVIETCGNVFKSYRYAFDIFRLARLFSFFAYIIRHGLLNRIFTVFRKVPKNWCFLSIFMLHLNFTVFWKLFSHLQMKELMLHLYIIVRNSLPIIIIFTSSKSDKKLKRYICIVNVGSRYEIINSDHFQTTNIISTNFMSKWLISIFLVLYRLQLTKQYNIISLNT